MAPESFGSVANGSSGSAPQCEVGSDIPCVRRDFCRGGGSKSKLHIAHEELNMPQQLQDSSALKNSLPSLETEAGHLRWMAVLYPGFGALWIGVCFPSIFGVLRMF